MGRRSGRKQKVRAEGRKKESEEKHPGPLTEESPQPPTDQLQDVSVDDAEKKRSEDMEGGESWANEVEEEKRQEQKAEQSQPKQGRDKQNSRQFVNSLRLEKHKQQSDGEKPATPKKGPSRNKDNRGDCLQNVDQGQESSEKSMELEQPAMSQKKRPIRVDSLPKDETSMQKNERSASPKKDHAHSRKVNNDRNKRERSTGGRDDKDAGGSLTDHRNDSRNSGRPSGDQNYGKGHHRDRGQNRDRDGYDPSGNKQPRHGEQNNRFFYRTRSDANDNRGRSNHPFSGKSEQGTQSHGRGRGFSSSSSFSNRQHNRDETQGKFDRRPWDKSAPERKAEDSAKTNQEVPESNWEDASYDNWPPDQAGSAAGSWLQPEDSTRLNPNAKPFENVPEESDDSCNFCNKPKPAASQNSRPGQSPDKPSQRRWNSPRRSETPRSGAKETSRNGYGDRAFGEVRRQLDSFRGAFVKVQEREGDLFAMPPEYSLAHCVAEDLTMGSGIAVLFSNKFKRREELYQQQQREGGLAILKDKERYIYYLVTKTISQGKPTLYTLWCSLQKMRQHMEENNVTKLAMPRIGCGLDRLEWDKVKPMIEIVFRDTNVEIVVCNLQQTEGTPPPKNSGGYIKHVAKPVVDIEAETTIVFLGTEDGHVSDTIQSLNAKFNFLSDYRSGAKKVGQVLRFAKKEKGYILYAFIVKKAEKDPLDLINFAKCIFEYKKLYKNDLYYFIGIEAFEESGMIDATFKAAYVFKQYVPYWMGVYVCWPSSLRHLMPGPVA